MTIKNRSEMPSRFIDLSGPDGNAYALMGYANNFAKQLKFTEEKIQEIMDDMRSSDYEHLVEVFDKHFGNIVTLYR
jgi:hypothetical protein